ncbi:MAG: glycosyltransferase family 2 protein, partial [Romboutsia sp.]|uniref:glycosyltransferase family 2 protein n=1 Tax=Romboutsia sp. TaxID=1965302 RepID=UPI003F3B8B78
KNFNQFKFTIIVAIYNNGEYLKNRCIESLKRSTIFDDIEILLIDDGSNDKETINIIKELEIKYKNIKTYFFQQGGSGSASRPRNKGIELSTTDYITYLDPDNEAVNDGYKILYDSIKNSEVDLVIGNIKFVNNTKESINDYYSVFLRNNHDNKSNDGKEILYKTEFMAQSIQALLVKKSIIIDNSLKMVNGAIGEDTLFFYQLLTYCNNIKVVKDVIHKYYTNREDSMTNSIDVNYFKKHLLLEKEKKIFLQEQDLIDGYLKYKQSYNFKVWILGKLKYCKKTDYLKAQNIIDEIYKVYKDIWIIEDKNILNYISRREAYLNKINKSINN